MLHGKGKVTSLHFTSGEGLAESVHFAGGTAASRLRQARAPAGRKLALLARRLAAGSRAFHQRAPHLAPCDVTLRVGHSKLRSGKPGWLALTARHNKSVEMDARVRPCAVRTRFPCATHVQR
jgi:hypothetical protein